MCDLFQANPWKPLLCTNCHQNRSGHRNVSMCDHSTTDLPKSTSSMHLYEEIMAQYFTTNVESVPTISTEEEDVDDDEVSFSDEEEDARKMTSIEFIQNQSMINMQGIVLMGPDLPIKENSEKKIRKISLLRKTKSSASDCLKKTEINENISSKLRWFKTKKTNQLPMEIEKPTVQKVRVLPDMSKLTINEALNIARRQHPSPRLEPRLLLNNNSKPSISSTTSNYGSSIASTASSSSTQSSAEYEQSANVEESTYLTAVTPNEKDSSLANIYDQTTKLILKNLTFDLRIILDEYKQNLPVARFQTLKSFLDQEQIIENLSNESIYFLLLQILDEFTRHAIKTFDHFLITNHSTIPILVPTTNISIRIDHDESIEEYMKNLAKKLFHPSSIPNFNNISTFENLAYRYLFNQIFPNVINDFDQNLSVQRVKLLHLFCKKIPSIRHMQINDENQRFIFALYYLMRFLSQSDH